LHNHLYLNKLYYSNISTTQGTEEKGTHCFVCLSFVGKGVNTMIKAQHVKVQISLMTNSQEICYLNT